MVALAKRPKPVRTMRVISNLGPVVVVAVDEGKRHDEYTVAVVDGGVKWTHREQPDRSYTVHCYAGRAITCDCPSRVECRHKLATQVLIERGDVQVVDTDDRPANWLVQGEFE